MQFDWYRVLVAAVIGGVIGAVVLLIRNLAGKRD